MGQSADCHSTAPSSSHSSTSTAQTRSSTPSSTQRWKVRWMVLSSPNSLGKRFLGQELRIMVAFAGFDTQVFLTQFMRQSMRIRDRLADRAEDLIRHRQRNRVVQFLVGDPGVAGFPGYALAWPTSLLPSPSLAEGLVRCQFQGSSLQSWTPHPAPPLPASISPPGTRGGCWRGCKCPPPSLPRSLATMVRMSRRPPPFPLQTRSSRCPPPIFFGNWTLRSALPTKVGSVRRRGGRACGSRRRVR